MPRPLKSPEDRRVKFDALYVTAAERTAIKAAAKFRGLSVNQYLIGLHEGHDRHRMQTRSNVLAAFLTAERQLERLANTIASNTAIDKIWILMHLINIERAFRKTAHLPVARSGKPTSEEPGLE